MSTDPERAILVAIVPPKGARSDTEESLQELEQLTDSAGGMVVAKFICPIKTFNPATLIGRGKVQEIKAALDNLEANLVIFDDNLSPAQQQNLETEFGQNVLDRTGLILDIFAIRARSHEGNLQVELAQLEYRLPRLTRLWVHLSRLGGGIGTRGPGETQLEVDRRVIRKKISKIKDELERVRLQRSENRKQRKRNALFTLALVGYTNAGKSLTLARLTSTEVVVVDQLFATLDPLTRRLDLPNSRPVLMSDTVGFIRKLPHQLIAAFKATLEEVLEADLLLHVIDLSHPRMEAQILAVQQVLTELNAQTKPILEIYNKADKVADLVPNLDHLKAGILHRNPDAVIYSALTGFGIPELLAAIQKAIAKHEVILEVNLDYRNQAAHPLIRNAGYVELADYREDGITYRIRTTREEATRLIRLLGDAQLVIHEDNTA